MEQVEWLLKLPFDTLALLSVGYLSYRLAYTGKDGAHSPVDVIFLTFVFASIARAAGRVFLFGIEVTGIEPPDWAATIFGVFMALLLAANWRKWWEGWLFELLRKFGISASDRHETAWQSALARPPAKGPTSLFVRCADGTRLLCESLADFNSAPFGPCILGQDGSVAMYVTHRKTVSATDWEEEQIPGKVDPIWGYQMTFLPASQVIEARITYPLSPSASAAAG